MYLLLSLSPAPSLPAVWVPVSQLVGRPRTEISFYTRNLSLVSQTEYLESQEMLHEDVPVLPFSGQYETIGVGVIPRLMLLDGNVPIFLRSLLLHRCARQV